MTHESAFIAALRAIATDPAARGLADDVALLGDFVLTHDMIVEGVHFLAHDPPEDVAWKLIATNLSDLAAKGAVPVGALLGCGLGRGAAWDARFLAGLGAACAAFALPLLGGDTVAMPAGAPLAFGLTAIGRAGRHVPARSGARAGHDLWVTGTIGDAGLGLAIARGAPGPETLRDRYRRPQPRLAAGARLAPIVAAMMDVSDGLLIDAGRMAEASGCAVAIDLEAMPLSAEALAQAGAGRAARLAAATAGDDYELLFAAGADRRGAVLTISQDLGLTITRIGHFGEGQGFSIGDRGGAVPLPARLGYAHGPS